MRPTSRPLRTLALALALLAAACDRDFLDSSAFATSDASGADADGTEGDIGPADAEDADEVSAADGLGDSSATDDAADTADPADAADTADTEDTTEVADAADTADTAETAETADAADTADTADTADAADVSPPPPPCQGGAGGLYSVALDSAGTQRALAAVVAVPAGGLVAVGRSSPGKYGGTDLLWLRLGLDGKLASLQEIGGAGDEEAHALSPLDDGGAIAVGERKSGTGTVDALWMRLDAAGGVLLQKEIPSSEGPDRLYDVTAAANGESVAVGVRSVAGGVTGDAVQGHVVGLDGAGNVSWSFVAGGKGEDALLAVARAATGTLAVGYRAGGAVGWAVHHDAAGGLVWQRTLDGLGAGGARLYATAMASGAAADSFAAGDRRAGPGAGAEGLVLRLDGSGRVRWFSTTAASGGLTFPALFERSGGELVALGTAGGVGARIPWLTTASRSSTQRAKAPSPPLGWLAPTPLARPTARSRACALRHPPPVTTARRARRACAARPAAAPRSRPPAHATTSSRAQPSTAAPPRRARADRRRSSPARARSAATPRCGRWSCAPAPATTPWASRPLAPAA